MTATVKMNNCGAAVSRQLFLPTVLGDSRRCPAQKGSKELLNVTLTQLSLQWSVD